MKLFADILKFLVQVFPLLMEVIDAEKERRQEKREKSVPPASPPEFNPSDSVTSDANP